MASAPTPTLTFIQPGVHRAGAGMPTTVTFPAAPASPACRTAPAASTPDPALRIRASVVTAGKAGARAARRER